MLEGDCAYIRVGGGDASTDAPRRTYVMERSDLSLLPELILSRLPRPANGIIVLESEKI